MSCKAKITSEQTVSIKLIINIIYSEKTHTHIFIYEKQLGFPGGSSGKESACSAGDLGSILGWRRSPREWNDYPLTVFWPGESLRQRSLVGYSPYGSKESDITERLTLTQQWEYSILKDHRKDFSLFVGGRW